MLVPGTHHSGSGVTILTLVTCPVVLAASSNIIMSRVKRNKGYSLSLSDLVAISPGLALTARSGAREVGEVQRSTRHLHLKQMSIIYCRET